MERRAESVDRRALQMLDRLAIGLEGSASPTFVLFYFAVVAEMVGEVDGAWGDPME